MRNNLLRISIIVLIIYFLAYLFSLKYRAYSHAIEMVHFLLVSFLTYMVGLLYSKENILSLFIKLFIPLLFGLVLYDFVIVNMLNETCILDGQGTCTHTTVDCDGACRGWYTFENEKLWITANYIAYWLVTTAFIFLHKFIYKTLTIKNSISTVLIVLGVIFIVKFIEYVNGLDDMGGPMTIITNGEFGKVAVTLGTIFLLMGDKLSKLSFRWIYIGLFIYSSYFIFKNIWLYSNIPFDWLLHSHKTIYPSLYEDIFALMLLIVFLFKSFKRKSLRSECGSLDKR